MKYSSCLITDKCVDINDPSILDFSVEYKGETFTYDKCRDLEMKFLLCNNLDTEDNIFSQNVYLNYNNHKPFYEKYTLSDLYNIIYLACIQNPMVFFILIANIIDTNGETQPYSSVINSGIFSQIYLFSKYGLGSIVYNPRQSCTTSTLVLIAIYCKIFTKYKVDIINRNPFLEKSFNSKYDNLYERIPDFYKNKKKTDIPDSQKDTTCVIIDEFEYSYMSKSYIYSYLNMNDSDIKKNTILFTCSTINDSFPPEFSEKVDSMITIDDVSKLDDIGRKGASSKKDDIIPVVRIKMPETKIFTPDQLERLKIILPTDAYRREVVRRRLTV